MTRASRPAAPSRINCKFPPSGAPRTRDWGLRTGSGGGPYITGTAQTGLLNIKIDKAAAGAVSPNGFRLSASAGALYHAVASRTRRWLSALQRTRSWRECNIFGLSGEVNSYLRANVAQPYLFTLGGPMRLSASSFDEFRGTDTYLARIGYMRRIAALPTGLGQGLYGIFGYEAGEIWSPQSNAILRQDGVAGLVANTPRSACSTFGVSVGDAGHRKVFVTLGRLVLRPSHRPSFMPSTRKKALPIGRAFVRENIRRGLRHHFNAHGAGACP